MTDEKKITLSIKVSDKKKRTEQVYNLDLDAITLGRLHSNDIRLDNTSVSRRHAQILRQGDSFFVMDLDSGNGTILNSRKLVSQERTQLARNDVIRIEDFEISVDWPESLDDIEEDTDSGVIEIRMIKKVLSAFDTEKSPSFETISDDVDKVKKYLGADMEEMIIGRDTDCTMSIESDVISRRHASIRKKWGGITITDLSSKNGTYVNSQKITEATLQDGDVISLGTVKVLFRNPQQIDLQALSREYEKEDKRRQKISQEDEIINAATDDGSTRPQDLNHDDSASDEAKKSVAEEENIEEPLFDTPEEEPVIKPAKKSNSAPYSTMEILLMAIGLLVFALSGAALYFLLK